MYLTVATVVAAAVLTQAVPTAGYAHTVACNYNGNSINKTFLVNSLNALCNMSGDDLSTDAAGLIHNQACDGAVCANTEITYDQTCGGVPTVLDIDTCTAVSDALVGNCSGEGGSSWSLNGCWTMDVDISGPSARRSSDPGHVTCYSGSGRASYKDFEDATLSFCSHVDSLQNGHAITKTDCDANRCIHFSAELESTNGLDSFPATFDCPAETLLVATDCGASSGGKNVISGDGFSVTFEAKVESSN